MSSKNYDRVKNIAEKEALWSGGSHMPWKGDAVVSPWFLERLCLLASYAPVSEVDRLRQQCEELDKE